MNYIVVYDGFLIYLHNQFFRFNIQLLKHAIDANANLNRYF